MFDITKDLKPGDKLRRASLPLPQHKVMVGEVYTFHSYCSYKDDIVGDRIYIEEMMTDKDGVINYNNNTYLKFWEYVGSSNILPDSLFEVY